MGQPQPGPPPPAALARRLGVGDAVVVGLASMVGAGVFSAFGPAARAAGSGLLLGLAVAAAVACCNALASAQLAAQYPTSGGAYVYGRVQLGPWWGFAAGWAFVVGKTASCAAMALTLARYAVPGPGWVRRLAAAAVVVGLAVLTGHGVTRTAAAARVLVAATLTVLAMVVAGIWAGGGAAGARVDWPDVGGGGVHGVLQAAGLLFFAFAGYARIATMGEEVVDPATTIPRAVPLALGITVAVYAAVGVSALAALGPRGLAGAGAPLTDAVRAAGSGGLAPVVRAGAALAAAGSLLALLTGVGRTVLAMAREADLPRWLGAVHPVHRVPHHAQAALAAAVCLLVVTLDMRTVLGFSSFGVLVYYGIAQLAALRQDPAHRRWPRGLNLAGFAGCATLAASLPATSVLAGAGVLAVGLVGRRLVRGAADR